MQRFLDCKNLKAIGFICFFLTIVAPALFPQWRLSFFVPLLIIACYQKPLITCLWLGFACGIFLDLLSSNTRLGITALVFGGSLAIIYPQRSHFFADSISTLPILTFAFVIITTLLTAILLYCIEGRNVFSWPWIWTDLIVLPFADACYSFFCFVLPALCFYKPMRRHPKNGNWQR